MLKFALTTSVLALAAVACLSASQTSATKADAKPAIAFSGQIMPALHVKNLAAAKAWYADVFGARVVYDLPEQGWCELSTPAKDVKLGLSANETTKGSGDAFVSFGVKDMSAAKAALVARNVKLDGDVVTIPGVVKLLYFADPDGNKLMFYQSLGT